MFLYLRSMATVAELTEELDPEAERIGGILRNLRDAREWTLQNLGAAVGRTHGYLSKVERGHVSTVKQLALVPAIAAAYGIATTELLAELYPADGPHQPPPGVELGLTTRKDGD
jgi:transcriptional regulator with XRE-family HTH domain